MSATRVALVTGGGTGIGAACCRALATAGFRVVVHYRGSEAAAQAVARELQGAFNIRADLAEPAEVEALVGVIKERAGRLDVLVNNAGQNRNAPTPTMTLDDYDAVVPHEARPAALHAPPGQRTHHQHHQRRRPHR